jgi:hypothetical protein
VRGPPWLLALGVGLLGWFPLIVLAVRLGPPVWTWLIGHLGTVGTVCAVLLVLLAVFPPRSRGNGRKPPVHRK